MAKELELKVLDVNPAEVRRRLGALGATPTERHDFRRVVFELPGTTGKAGRSIRVRTDGRKSTMTLKERTGFGITETDEYEVEVSDFETAAKMLYKLIGKNPLYEFSTRDECVLDGVHVSIDKWPGIPPYVEIEGPTVSSVKRTYAKLRISGRLIGHVPHGEIYRRFYRKDYIAMAASNDAALRRLLGRQRKR